VHRLTTSFVLGYHGCDRAVGESLLDGATFKPSNNEYDWLGSGVYFWEANPVRGLEFACEPYRRGIKDPFVVGAVIDLGACLDLTTSTGIGLVEKAYRTLADGGSTGTSVPANSDDGLRRYLDCAVIRRAHTMLAELGMQPVDSVRGLFIEGEPIYKTAGFYSKTHVQIAVCNPACIKGVFRVPKEQLASGSR
jgi:hypothetical protein